MKEKPIRIAVIDDDSDDGLLIINEEDTTIFSTAYCLMEMRKYHLVVQVRPQQWLEEYLPGIYIDKISIRKDSFEESFLMFRVTFLFISDLKGNLFGIRCCTYLKPHSPEEILCNAESQAGI